MLQILMFQILVFSIFISAASAQNLQITNCPPVAVSTNISEILAAHNKSDFKKLLEKYSTYDAESAQILKGYETLSESEQTLQRDRLYVILQQEIQDLELRFDNIFNRSLAAQILLSLDSSSKRFEQAILQLDASVLNGFINLGRRAEISISVDLASNIFNRLEDLGLENLVFRAIQGNQPLILKTQKSILVPENYNLGVGLALGTLFYSLLGEHRKDLVKKALESEIPEFQEVALLYADDLGVEGESYILQGIRDGKKRAVRSLAKLSRPPISFGEELLKANREMNKKRAPDLLLTEFFMELPERSPSQEMLNLLELILAKVKLSEFNLHNLQHLAEHTKSESLKSLVEKAKREPPEEEAVERPKIYWGL